MDNRIENIAFEQMVLEKTLKSSDHSRVCLVRDKQTHTRYIYRTFLGDGNVYRKMLDVSCPYLPKIYEVKEADGVVYVLEEYIQGDTLAFLLELKPLEEPLAQQIVTQICFALRILHRNGIIHRDIKPENLIVRGGDVVLIDFDASRLSNETNPTDTRIMGTTGYAAPEQYGFSQTDARADIYALGILLNEMLTKQHPSKKMTEGAFRPIVEKCTRLNVDQRYASVSELLDAFQSLKKPKKHLLRLLWLSLGFVLLLVCGVLMFFAFSRSEEEAPVIEVFSREEQEITMEAWTGDIEGYATPFKCDMDGDGNKESYLFGIDYIDSPHENIVYYDRNHALPDIASCRNVHPCVWRVFDDGTMKVAMEFADLLTDAQVKIWRVDDFLTPEPVAWTMDYVWPGCVSVTFSPVQDGTWLYEVEAYFGEYRLTAIATTSFYFE